jgi:quercetin dioxygenase-like cupin family protein
MIEKIYNMTDSNEKTVEMLISDENVHYLHMIFNKGEGLPEHFSNSNVYMTVLKGTLSIGLGEQEVHEYTKGTVLKIPFKTKMNVVGNRHDEILELTVVKAPPRHNHR